MSTRILPWRQLITGAVLLLIACSDTTTRPQRQPPSITAHPTSLTVAQGQSAAFHVTASGDAPLRYQWRKNGADIPSATQASYTIANVSVSDNGVGFDVRVSNDAGDVTSSRAVLSVNRPPQITTQPQHVVAMVGAQATFTVSADGSSPLAYQWRRNGVDIPAANGAVYTVGIVDIADDGASFDVRVSNEAGFAVSVPAILTVNRPPSITTQPQSVTAGVGSPAVFSVVATGTAPLTYQWRRGGVNLPAATSPTYSISNVAATDHGAAFDVRIENSAGAVLSSAAILTVNRPPVITAQPQNVTANAGGQAIFSVVADGTAPLTYRWYRNGVIIATPSSPSHTVSNVSEADNGTSYRVEVTNAFGSVFSNSVTLTVNQAPHITIEPADVTIGNGEQAAFVVSATSNTPVQYQWRRDGVNIPGATAASYAFHGMRADSGAVFSVVVSNATGSTVSRNAKLSVGGPYYGLGGFRPSFAPGTSDLIGARFRVRIVETTTFGIIFGFNEVYAPGSIVPGYIPYMLESNIYAGTVLYQDNGCTTWPPLGTFTNGSIGSIRLALGDYAFHHGQELGRTTGIRTTDPVNYPVQQYVIDGINAFPKADAISQFDVKHTDMLVTIERGQTVTDVSAYTRCGVALLPRTYRQWSIKVEMSGRAPYTSHFVVPDAKGRYLVAGSNDEFSPYNGVMNFASEFLHMPGPFTVQYWDFAAQRESNPTWTSVSSFRTSPLYDGNTRDYGVRVVNVGGRDRVEFSNRAGNTYLRGSTTFTIVP